jgi:hypothetical protein
VTFEYGSIRSEEHARVIDILSHSFVAAPADAPVWFELYTGFHSARALRRMGEIEADDDTLEILDGWFAGPLPPMREHF